jgi:hypothetical protein
MIFAAFKKVFRNIQYLTIAFTIAASIFVLSLWLPNLKLIWQIIISSTASLTDKLAILLGLLGSIKTNFTVFSAFYTIAIAVLFGINVAMIVYYIKQRRKFNRQSGIVISTGGLASGILGISCASCGFFLLTSVLPLVGMGGLFAFLPLGGQEFGILGVVILCVSTFLTAKTIQTGFVCEADFNDRGVNV